MSLGRTEALLPPRESTTSGRTLVAGALIVLAAGLATVALFGPVPALIVVTLGVVSAAVARFEVLALAVPILVAPVGLVDVPGLFGVQVIHLATIAAIGGVLFAVLSGRIGFAPPAAMAWGTLFAASILLSTVASADPATSLRVSVNHLLSLGLACAAAIVVRYEDSGLMWLLRCWTVAAAMLVLPALPSALLASQRFGGTLIEGRVQGAFAQPNDFGEFALLGLVASAALCFGSTNRIDAWLGALGIAITLAGVAVSFSRGTWMGLAAGLATMALLSPRMRLSLVGTALLISGVVAVGTVTATPPFPTITARLLGLVTGGMNPEDDRPVVYAQALRVFVENPVVGLGPGTFLESNHAAGSALILRTYIHGHSIVGTIAAELGLVGVVTILLFTGALAVAAIRGRTQLLAMGDARENARLAALAGGLVAIAVHGLVDVVYTNPLLIPLAWFLAGTVAGECARIDDRYGGRRRPARMLAR